MNKSIMLLVLAVSLPALAEQPAHFMKCFDIASRSYQIDMDLLMAVATVESGWDASARSSANAHGLMQIRWPLTARHLGVRRVAELYNPCLNIDLGARYLSELSSTYKGDDRLMLAAYNYGPTRLHSVRDIPPSVDRYVNKVLDHRRRIAGRLMSGSEVTFEQADSVEVIRFSRPGRARDYTNKLRELVPGAVFRIVDESASESVVLLDTRGLSGENRYRLNRLLPGIEVSPVSAADSATQRTLSRGSEQQ